MKSRFSISLLTPTHQHTGEYTCTRTYVYTCTKICGHIQWFTYIQWYLHRKCMHMHTLLCICPHAHTYSISLSLSVIHWSFTCSLNLPFSLFWLTVMMSQYYLQIYESIFAGCLHCGFYQRQVGQSKECCYQCPHQGMGINIFSWIISLFTTFDARLPVF